MSKTETIFTYRQFVKRMTSGRGVATPDGGCPVGVALKTEYALTDLGKATVPIVHAMDKWGADFFTRLGVPIPCDET